MSDLSDDRFGSRLRDHEGYLEDTEYEEGHGRGMMRGREEGMNNPCTHLVGAFLYHNRHGAFDE